MLADLLRFFPVNRGEYFKFRRPFGRRGVRSLVGAALVDVGKECSEPIEIFVRVRIVAMMMALGASQRRSHPDGSEITHPVGGIDREIFLVLGAAFMRGLQHTIVAGRNPLIDRGLWQQV